MPIAPGLSVVIPTRDRCSTLALTLASLERQNGFDTEFEVIVVDDGSTDQTAEWLAARQSQAFELSVLRTSGLGPATARNRGLEIAAGSRVLLLGDDTIPQAGALAAHPEAAKARDVAVQGFIEWDPTEPITELMRFLAPEGPQFWFKGFLDHGPVPFTSVYGSNLSAPTRWFREEPFDETFPAACFEDTEMAWRWSRRGWRMVFARTALCTVTTTTLSNRSCRGNGRPETRLEGWSRGILFCCGECSVNRRWPVCGSLVARCCVVHQEAGTNVGTAAVDRPGWADFWG